MVTDTSKYEIWLTFDGERQKFRFPVLPEKINLKQDSDNTSLNIVGLGEITIMQDKPEAQVSWRSFFPANAFPGMQVERMIWPEEIKFMLKTWMGSKKPCHLIVTGTKINLYCTIEQFDCSESGGAVGDLDYSITFKEYRQPVISQVEVEAVSAGGEEEDGQGEPEVIIALAQKHIVRQDNTVNSETYTVERGDCLYNIALAELGDANRWREIAALNDISSPYLIFPDQVLQLPE